ncbi:hypothetical protein KJ641_00040 [Patescibacteria group bacterium]|nr:hypothetical protein [Patescibacteria group bacterium]
MATIKKEISAKKDDTSILRTSSALQKNNGSGAAVFLLMILLIIAIGGFVWSFSKYQKTKQRVAYLSTQEGQVELSQKEVEAVLEKVKKHILLPTDEDPIIATIVDAATLKQQQDFYKDANNDDKLIIYKQKAIIYSPMRDLIVNVGPVFIQEGEDPVNPEVSANSNGDLEVTKPETSVLAETTSAPNVPLVETPIAQ